MTNAEMLSAFRVYGQQMGMQKMRTILDNEIYTFINSAIIEKIRQLLGTNVAAQFADKASTQQNAISPINYVRTLIKTKDLTVTENSADTPSDTNIMYILGVTAEGYKCRFIEPTDLEATINDYCNSPSKEYPLFTYIDNSFKVYNGEPSINSCKLQYIEMPLQVDNNNSCNLPDYTHDEIVQLAVKKYFASLQATANNVN